MKKVIGFIVIFIFVVNNGQILLAQSWSTGYNKIYVNPPYTKVGIGTIAPNSTLHVNAGTGVDGLRVQISGYTKLLLHNNGGLSVGDSSTPPPLGLFVSGPIGIGTPTPVSWAQFNIHKAGSAAYIRLSGTGDGGNFSGINFTSDESSDKQWEIIHRQTPANSLLFAYNNGSQWKNQFIIMESGNVGIGTITPDEKLTVNGTTKTTILEITGGSDLAESFNIYSEPDYELIPGMVVSINPEKPGELKLADTAYDKKVAGVISGANGINPGLLLNQKETIADGEFPVALAGRVYCYADASLTEIRPGDLLTTSNTPGYAMKVSDYDRANGAAIGKAMTSLKKGEKGLILVLISLN